ncbi:endoplasmic reticulum membrane protein-like [Pyrus ussuriensis x Pyrus communis]|uniref:Endoplasmic reticulum membrane protein-like n=1 Tax=Pyrus ussuriensis x Pyrus communis TaxID=2448454 RepID=A0A5N5I4V9_9ROSA|nr:endoplasmic reticulum membrane protein-like [Pyrus ussuriensis x Pyrus communis]
MGRTGLFDLERHFAFYGAYHSNPVNILIHNCLCGRLSSPLWVCFHCDVCLDKKAGSIAALLCVLCWVQSTLLASRLGFSLSWKKRAPTLRDNLVQAFLMGPFFVLLECLQSVFGYEPYEGFHASVEEKIEARIKEWQDKKQKKITKLRWVISDCNPL